MMKMAMTALAVVFLAQTAPALAEPDINNADAAERLEPRPGREWQGERPRWRAPEAAVLAPQALQAPQAREADRPRGGVPGDSIGRAGPWVREGGRPEPRDDRRWDGADRPPTHDIVPRQETDRRWQDQARGGGDHGRPDGNPDGGRGGDRDRQYGDRHGWDRRGGDHDDRDRQYGDRKGWDRDARDDRRHDHDRWGRDRWDQGRYPPVYHSSHRYRHYWRPPSGFYVRAWGYGDYLPRSWYGGDYWVVDPWRYDLPLPPPGFDWVRVGDDAVLVDRFSGRIVQVVRDVFW